MNSVIVSSGDGGDRRNGRKEEDRQPSDAMGPNPSKCARCGTLTQSKRKGPGGTWCYQCLRRRAQLKGRLGPRPKPGRTAAQAPAPVPAVGRVVKRGGQASDPQAALIRSLFRYVEHLEAQLAGASSAKLAPKVPTRAQQPAPSPQPLQAPALPKDKPLSRVRCGGCNRRGHRRANCPNATQPHPAAPAGRELAGQSQPPTSEAPMDIETEDVASTSGAVAGSIFNTSDEELLDYEEEEFEFSE
ncbi:---NA--- [Olea europaea subsp. europaea]|uniref:---NA n=1 Tax=Olea europaea subsp. europaea TaxID=158383 RepID=A0A8S0VG70_OLEEU|nr:---NA--- [Olea europaea subsp. europaea]